MRFLSYFIICSFFIIHSFNAQVINGYAKVTAINGTKTILTVSNSNETGGSTATFSPGMEILIIQTQDSVLGNVTNTTSFGDLGSLRNAGKFEFTTIASVTRPAGVLTTITLVSGLTGTFSTGTNASLQIVTFPVLGSPNFVTTSNIIPLAWDGNIGGIINFKVNGNLTLGHLINAKGYGFRGGALNANNANNCENNVYFSAANNKYSGKGEGIFKNTNVLYNIAKGKLINGGGGGIIHNGGGGGGGNYSNGGNGGNGFNNTGSCTGSAGGLGGLALSGFISNTRVFFGGGGGSGQQNNSLGVPGGNGGGIIFIKADTIKSGVGCGVLIDASGNTTPTGGNDGVGGGGAGGSVFIDAKDFKIDVSCPLSIKGDGGSAGFSNVGAPHGGGGGGGQGVIIFSNARPTINVISTVLNGVGGADNTGGIKTSTNGSGVSNTGIFQNLGPLPVELLYFYVEKQNEKVALNWATASEKNNKKFTIYRSKDLQNWTAVSSAEGQMNSSQQIDYKTYDYSPNNGLNYYLLEQEDINGTKEKFNVQVVEYSQMVTSKIKVYPNPSNGNQALNLENINSADVENLSIINIAGKTMSKSIITKNDGTYVLNIDGYAEGIYLVYIQGKSFKFIVSK